MVSFNPETDVLGHLDKVVDELFQAVAEHKTYEVLDKLVKDLENSYQTLEEDYSSLYGTDRHNKIRQRITILSYALPGCV